MYRLGINFNKYSDVLRKYKMSYEIMQLVKNSRVKHIQWDLSKLTTDWSNGQRKYVQN